MTKEGQNPVHCARNRPPALRLLPWSSPHLPSSRSQSSILPGLQAYPGLPPLYFPATRVHIVKQKSRPSSSPAQILWSSHIIRVKGLVLPWPVKPSMTQPLPASPPSSPPLSPDSLLKSHWPPPCSSLSLCLGHPSQGLHATHPHLIQSSVHVLPPGRGLPGPPSLKEPRPPPWDSVAPCAVSLLP